MHTPPRRPRAIAVPVTAAPVEPLALAAAALALAAALVGVLLR